MAWVVVELLVQWALVVWAEWEVWVAAWAVECNRAKLVQRAVSSEFEIGVRDAKKKGGPWPLFLLTRIYMQLIYCQH